MKSRRSFAKRGRLPKRTRRAGRHPIRFVRTAPGQHVTVVLQEKKAPDPKIPTVGESHLPNQAALMPNRAPEPAVEAPVARLPANPLPLPQLSGGRLALPSLRSASTQVSTTAIKRASTGRGSAPVGTDISDVVPPIKTNTGVGGEVTFVNVKRPTNPPERLTYSTPGGPRQRGGGAAAAEEEYPDTPF